MLPVETRSARASVEDASRFYCNCHCKYFPCHETDGGRLNCIFCYCPMYYLPACLGSPQYITGNGSLIKDCSGCLYPHRPENYKTIIDYLVRAKHNGIQKQRNGERYRTFFEQSKDAIFITSRRGSIIDCNQSASALLGYSREEMMRLTAHHLYARPADRLRFQHEIELKGYVEDYEMILRKKDGAEIVCLYTFTVRRADNGRIVGYQGILRDVTARKKAGWKEERSFVVLWHTENNPASACYKTLFKR